MRNPRIKEDTTNYRHEPTHVLLYSIELAGAG
jgi:hypothetical protein